MHSLLTKLLSKRGIQSPEELSPEERTTFDEWKLILSNETLSLTDVQRFCQQQLDIIEGKWNDLNTLQERKAELIPYYTVYKNILAAISAPKVAREQLEKHLIQLTQ